jgi:hypothetical protein
MIVTDPAKLRAAAHWLTNNDPENSSDNQDFVTAAEYAGQQWLWGVMLAPFYTSWVLPAGTGANPYCTDSSARYAGHPWANNNDNGTPNWTSGIGVGASNSRWNWFIGYDTRTNGNWGFVVHDTNALLPDGLPASISNPLFGQPIDKSQTPSATNNAGAIMPYFALRYLPFQWPVIAPQSQWNSTPAPKGCQPANNGS